jgi:hypothetical protein
LRDKLAHLTEARDEAVRAQVEHARNYVAPDRGLLAQLTILRGLVQDREIAAVILLINATAFGLEFAAVLAKVTTFIPTAYAALLARDAYLRVTAIVDEIDETISGRGRAASGNSGPRGEARSDGGPSNFTWFPDGSKRVEPPPLARRPRGRPRKDGFNGGSPSVPGEDKGGPDKHD